MKHYDVFISYRRDGGWALGQLLYVRLSMDGYSVFYDIESMRSGKFNKQIYDSIDNSSAIVVVLPPHALDRCVNEDDWVRKEIAYAIKQNKMLIPVMMQGFVFPDDLPEDIKDLKDFHGVTAERNISADYWYEDLKKYINEQLDHMPEPQTPRQADRTLHQAEMTDGLINACRENNNNTILALLEAIRTEGFLNEQIMETAILHFLENQEWESAEKLIVNLADTFPESKNARVFALHHLLHDFPKYNLALIRQTVDWLLNHAAIDEDIASSDVFCDLLAGQTESALEKLEAYKKRSDDLPDMSEVASEVFYRAAIRHTFSVHQGDYCFSSKAHHRLWKRYMKLALSECRDKDRRRQIRKEWIWHSIPWFVWPNLPAILFLLVLSFSTIPSPWIWLIRAILVAMTVFSVIPAWRKDFYRATKKLTGIHLFVKRAAKIIIFPLWLMLNFMASVFGISIDYDPDD